MLSLCQSNQILEYMIRVCILKNWCDWEYRSRLFQIVGSYRYHTKFEI